MAGKVKVLLFSRCREAVGKPEIEVPLATPVTVGEFMDGLAREHPGLAAIRGSVLIAVNQEYVGPGARVSPGDEVALIPPVAGGAVADG